MPQKTNPLSLDQAKALKLPALRMGQLSDAMMALQLMDKLCIASLELAHELPNPHDDNEQLLPNDILLDIELVDERGGVKALQNVLIDDFNVNADEFVEDTYDEISSVVIDRCACAESGSLFDIDYNSARFGDTDRTTLRREIFRQQINETVAELLPQLKETVNRIA